MADGLVNNIHVGYIIQARMKSTRLPGKILLPLPFNQGKPLLKWITDVLKKSKYEKQIIIATSENPENDVLENFCLQEQIEVFRGEEQNVLSRFISIIKTHHFDVIVRLTADNPIVDLDLLENAIEQHVQLGKDYTKTEGLPIGMNFEIINPLALLRLDTNQLSEQDKEHVTLSIRNFSTNKLFLNLGDKESEKLRLTVDYPSDYAVLSLVLAIIGEYDNSSFEQVSEITKKYPWIFEVNQANIQKRQYLSDEEERIDAIAFLQMMDFKRTANALLEMGSKKIG